MRASTEGPNPPQGRRRAWALFGVLFLALFVRLYGVAFSLPSLYHPDEATIVSVAMQVAGGDINPHFFNYPSLFIYFSTFMFGLSFAVGHVLGVFPTVEAFTVHYWLNPTIPYFVLRFLVACLGTLTVYFVYRIARELRSERVGFLAALFLSVSFLHVRVSHYAITDVPMTCLLTIAAFYSVRIYQTGEARAYVLAGLFAGLTASTKYNGGLVVVCIFLAHVFYLHRRATLAWAKLFDRSLLAAAACATVAFVVTSPFVLIEFTEFMADFQYEVGHMRDGHTGARADLLGMSGWFYHLRYSLPNGFGLVTLAAFAFSLIRAAFRRDAILLTIFILPVCYFLAVGSWNITWDRYLVVLSPFVCIGAAEAVASLFAWKRFESVGKIVGALIVVAAVIIPAQKVWQFDRLLQTEDTRIQALRWIQMNIPAGEAIGIDVQNVKIPEGTSTVADYVSYWAEQGGTAGAKYEFLHAHPEITEAGYRPFLVGHQFAHIPPEYLVPFDLEELMRRGVRYVLISGDYVEVAEFESAVMPERAKYYRDVKAIGDLVTQFSPYDSDSNPRRVSKDGYTAYRPFYPFSRWAGGMSRMGPRVEIYRLP